MEHLELVNRVLSSKNYYEALGVKKEATDSEIEQAYKKVALQIHPDKNPSPEATEAFKVLGKAYATLSDSQKRKEYDFDGSKEQVKNQQPHSFNQQRQQNWRRRESPYASSSYRQRRYGRSFYHDQRYGYDYYDDDNEWNTTSRDYETF